ncbi:MAG: hypothetical protein IJP70_11555 [Bacteroidales bacterium]|nr:hypothetical protein [Bacteroidales bacterium]
MSIKRFSLLLMGVGLILNTVSAQEEVKTSKSWIEKGFFNHLEVGVNAGSTGIGIDVATSVSKYARLRVGFTYMPRFQMKSNFGVSLGDSAYHRTYSPTTGKRTDKLGKMIDYMHDLTGMTIEDNVDMVYKPTFYNSKLLVDVFPFTDKRWHFTAGFYYGTREIGRAVNSVEDATTLAGVSFYNYIYDKVAEDNPNIFGDLISITPEVLNRIKPMFLNAGRMGMHVGRYKHNVYGQVAVLDELGYPVYDDEGNPMYEQGIIHAKGSYYMMTPDPENCTVKCYAKTRRFKPYVGGGYSGSISKDKLWNLDVDLGVLFWGGTPHVYTHDGTDLTRDVYGIQGKVGKYIDAIASVKVFPVLEVRISRRIF